VTFREHPGLTYRGISNWPPVWTYARKSERKVQRGEIGKLIYVHANTQLSDRCFLVIDYGGVNYVGTLIFSDRSVCSQIITLLRQSVGKPISDIGDLDVSHML
jgi:hypothetical protein